MPQIIAWQCPATHKIFADKSEYEKHLRVLARERTRCRRIEKYRRERDERLLRMRNTLISFEEIENWFEDPENGKFIVSRVGIVVPTHGKQTDIENFQFTQFSFTNMKWDMCCSNSHNAPKGKKTNWGGREDYPRGFPGWRGRITFSYTGAYGVGGDVLKETGIHTGSGGSGGKERYSFECTLFAEEWAGMTVWEKLSQ